MTSPVFYILGLLIAALAVLMLVPAAVGLATPEDEAWIAFGIAALLVGTLGGVVALANRRLPVRLTLKQGFVLTALGWGVLPGLAALPLLFPPLALAPADAVFEAVSGLTTTGATVLTGLDTMAPAVLLWRSLLQWVGGIGIIVMAIAVLPILRVGGLQLFRIESADGSRKALPRINSLLGYVVLAYGTLTAAGVVAYAAAGLPGFEAVNHAMTTISTGGFSTSDRSFDRFDAPAIHYVAVAFMIAGALPFALYLRLGGRHGPAITRNVQVRGFLLLALAVTAVLAVDRVLAGGFDWEPAIRYSLFNVVSILSTTGYVSTDYGAWGPFAVALFFGLTFVGGCTGSTAGGIKIFRFQVAFIAAWHQLHHLFEPSGVRVLRYAGRPLPDDVMVGVGGFFLMFALSMAALASGLAAAGCDFETSVTGAATALTNVGPGLGAVIGPGGTYQPLPVAAKMVLALGMLMGRLELFVLLVLLSARFYQR